MRRRSLARIPIHLVLFGAIVGVTTFYRRAEAATIYFSIYILVAALLQILILWKVRAKSGLSRIEQFSVQVGFYSLAIFWGSLCFYSVIKFELGWTSFFITLVTCAIAAGEASTFAPKFSLLVKLLLIVLLPSILINFMLVSGMRGFAIGGFLFGFLVYLFIEGRFQFTEYWSKLRQNARLNAVIDAMPGTLAWVRSDLRYLGVNRNSANLFGMSQNDFIGKEVGFTDPSSPVVSFAKNLFSGEAGYLTAEVQRPVSAGVRNFFLFGQKYNFDTEAVILGLDMTDGKNAAQAVMNERAQRLYTARLANLGQIFFRVCAGLRPEAQRLGAPRLKRTLDLLEALAHPPVGTESLNCEINEIIENVSFIFSDFAKEHGVALQSTTPKGELKVKSDPIQILELVISLVNNSFDAVADLPEKWVKIQSTVNEKWAEISILDSGPGIPKEFQEKIFEPLFTTKDPLQSTGVGLSVGREIAEQNGGTLELVKTSANTHFFIRLPLA